MAATKDTLLIRAAERGDAKEVCRLLSVGADAKAQDIFGRTGLMWAASHGHTECVDLLLGSDAYAQDKDGRSALMLAARAGHLKCVEMLLPVSNAYAQAEDGRTAAKFASLYGHEALAV
jgi:ankyrin repeat protein